VQSVLHVVDGIRHVIGPVHDLGFQAEPPVRGPVPDPRENLGVLRVDAVLAGAIGKPRVLERRVQGGPGQVEAGPGDLRFQPGEQAQRLRVPLEPAQLVERRLAVVAERAVADVVGQAGRVHQVGVAA
jgi:hypothetical protein